MYKVRVLQEIDDRLDAEYYNPAALSTLKKMENKGTVTTFGSLVNEGYRVVYHGTDSINGLKDSELLPFLSPTQIDPNGAISFDDADKLPLYYKERYPKGLAKVGEILVEVKGNVSKVGIVPLDFPKNLMISGSLYKATLDPKRADSHYVLAFLKSRHGQILKNRLTSNTIINYIAKDALYSIPVIEFGEKAQKYIGDKVRQAEQLRAWAKSTQDSIKSYFDGLMPDLDLQSRVYKAPIKSLDNRMDATYYLPKYVELDSYFATKSHNVRPLAHYIENKISGPAIPSNQFYTSGTGVLVLQTKDIRENYIDKKTCSKITKSSADELTRFQVGAGTLLMGMSGTIGRTALVFDPNEKYIINQRVAALILNDIKISGYLCAYLNHSFGRHQLQRQSVGGVQANIGLSEISSTKILVADRGYAEKISELFIESLIAQKLSTTLTDAAKTLVEALIEGQLTEQQLIQAQQTLDDGDNSLDQAILSKLSNEGYAIDGATPLFSDIDELYRLLVSAAQAEAEE
ncbi:restriction endonuclease subunit S [Vibrio cholerae]|uniref:restriction endonuclease subunit S n=1 Tax=Vibrio cholerae TaxID=666 RepID=UPI001A9EF0CF|nr:restriction endonuclease subunit S [Vibrio cholerae]MBO1380986.1 restriction endonuclease subunit S [Vibrio cholerae]MBO1388748.1 restriction endonuclease subunit S [Vibrio cholerae]MBO1395223.1 restriction endonuclease subunit S [Vibrio cholerae]